MGLTKFKLKQFAAFSELDLAFSPGINVFVGGNGTGKTHLMKVCYAACDVAKTGDPFAEKLIRVFLPSGRALGRLVKRQKGRNTGVVEVCRGNRKLRASFSTYSKVADSATITGANLWKDSSLESVFIPVHEMLANGAGFRSLYERREIQFEEIYADILGRAYLPVRRGPMDNLRKRLITILEKAMAGKVITKNEEFFLRNRHGNLEFSLLAEGMRKLGLLWLLIQNGILQEDSVLFWDEPETNLNPKLFGTVMKILLELQRAGVQIFFATHDYVILKELDLLKKDEDAVAFHSLYRDETGEIVCHTTNSYLGLHPNAIAEVFTDLYDREIERSLGGI